ncbi:hypothetical protein QIH95_48070 (plasmid) [Bradyrhizobium japonicum]|nr:hypothetical protein [Bradyrhizobium japonicum]WLB24309.1 hypothetical protein QIH95_48070 [Bradyrhizobium japonicum]
MRAHLRPHRPVDTDSDLSHDREQVGLRAEPGPAPGEIAARAFEDLDLPPDVPK